VTSHFFPQNMATFAKKKPFVKFAYDFFCHKKFAKRKESIGA
jgi:hypothetical protein